MMNSIINTVVALRENRKNDSDRNEDERSEEEIMKGIELKKCPFCGGKAGLYQTYDGRYVVECNECGTTCKMSGYKDKVINEWNNRVGIMPICSQSEWLQVADDYGERQIPLVIEEMAELTQALTKYMRATQGGQRVRKTMQEIEDSVKEELSDVIVMMIQLQYLFHISNDEINQIADKKLEKTLNLMEGIEDE